MRERLKADAERPIDLDMVRTFCDACHDYAAVDITCFECHSDRAGQ